MAALRPDAPPRPRRDQAGTGAQGPRRYGRAGTFHHSGYVRWVGVASEARGRGVGRSLMRYAEERVFKAGPNVFLLVADFNLAAQAFCEDLGYTRVGAIPDYVVRGVTELLYRKTRGPIAAKGRKAR